MLDIHYLFGLFMRYCDHNLDQTYEYVMVSQRSMLKIENV